MSERTPNDVLIVTGMSGAGRSTVANALEDLGWYVVDNLPPQMLRPLLDLAMHPGSALPSIAAVVDVRGGKLFADLASIIGELRERAPVRVVYLDATDQALVRRFEQVRRPHPLQADGTLLDGIARERALMSSVRELSDLIIDTSEYNIHQLATTVTELFADEGRALVRVTLESFGFKYGIPTDADIVADARFLPNPFWQDDLRGATGRDPRVSEFVLEQEGRGSSCSTSSPPWAPSSPGTLERTSLTRRSRSAAPAASIARSRSSRNSPHTFAACPASM